MIGNEQVIGIGLHEVKDIRVEQATAGRI